MNLSLTWFTWRLANDTIEFLAYDFLYIVEFHLSCTTTAANTWSVELFNKCNDNPLKIVIATITINRDYDNRDYDNRD